MTLPKWVVYNGGSDLYVCRKCGEEATQYAPPPDYMTKDLVTSGILSCPKCGDSGELANMEDPMAKVASEQLKPELNHIKDVQSERITLLEKYKYVSKAEKDNINSLLLRWSHCSYPEEKKQIESQLVREANIPTLIAMLLEQHVYGYASVMLGKIKPEEPDAAKALGLQAVNKSVSALGALVNFGIYAHPAAQYLELVLTKKVDNVMDSERFKYAALCLAQWIFPENLLPLVLRGLAESVKDKAYDSIYYDYGIKSQELAFKQLLRIGEAAKETVLSLINEYRLSEEQTHQALVCFGIEDPVVELIVALKTGPETRRLDAAAELEKFDDKRASKALSASAEYLSKLRLQHEVEFHTDFAQIHKMRGKIVEALAKMEISSTKEFRKKWTRSVQEIPGKERTAEWLIAKIKEESDLIILFVADIDNIKVECKFSRDEVAERGMNIIIWRKFRNGSVDFLPHPVIRIGEDIYLVGYQD
jgi:hypothetical protein